MTAPFDPFTALATPDEPRRPRERFVDQLRRQLLEEAMTDIEPTATTDPRAGTGLNQPDDRSFTSYTGGASNLFYFSLAAPDLERSKAFFGRVLGWEVAGGTLGGHIANITPAGGLVPNASPRDATLTLTVDDLEAAMEQVVAAGGTIEGQVMSGEPGDWVNCRDDQGTRISLQYPGTGNYAEHARRPRKGDAHGDLFYFSLPVADGEQARRFYHQVFGWELSDPGPQGGMNARNLIIDGGVQAGSPGDTVMLWFRVDDLANSVELIRELGGDATEPEDTPQGLIASCHDDQGVPFGLVEPAPGY